MSEINLPYEPVPGGPVLQEVTVYGTDLSKLPSLAVDPVFPNKLEKIQIPEPEDPQRRHDALIAQEWKRSSNGFYYDTQLSNELISVSLHPNTETSDGGITWNRVSGAVDETPGKWPYRIEPLVRAILNEDYQTAVSNNWNVFGDDAIGGLFNQFKPYAPYLGHLSKMVKEMNSTEEAMKATGDKDISSTFGKIMDKITDVVGAVADEGAQILNRSLIVQGARFSYYSGTGVGFGNLQMKFTVFADWDENGEFKSVDSQLQELYPYCFGKFVKFLDENGNVTGLKEDGGVNKFVQELDIVQAHKDMINTYFGWQLPPAGFEANIKDIDICQKGTLKLKFGAFYSIDNLVISDAQFNFSRQMVKNWDKESQQNDISPLSCDVVLTFKPASKFTDNKLYEFISGKNMQRERTSMEKRLYDNLLNKMMGVEDFLEGNGELH